MKRKVSYNKSVYHLLMLPSESKLLDSGPSPLTLCTSKSIEMRLIITCTAITRVKNIQAGCYLRAIFSTIVSATPNEKMTR